MEKKKHNEAQSNAPLPAHSSEFEQIEVPYHGITDRNLDLGKRIETSVEGVTSSEPVSGGDIDVNQYQAEVSGEEAVGGKLFHT